MWQNPNRIFKTVIAIQRKTMNQNSRYMSCFCNPELIYPENTGTKEN